MLRPYCAVDVINWKSPISSKFFFLQRNLELAPLKREFGVSFRVNVHHKLHRFHFCMSIFQTQTVGNVDTFFRIRSEARTRRDGEMERSERFRFAEKRFPNK